MYIQLRKVLPSELLQTAGCSIGLDCLDLESNWAHAKSMLLCTIVKLVELVDRIEVRKTDCFGKTRLVPHVPSS